MADLARLAGVSVSTVSRALSDNPQVPERTRLEILRLAQTHGFVANIGARRLRLSRTETIAVAVHLGPASNPAVTDPFLQTLLGRLADEIADRGYDLLLTRVRPSTEGWLSRLLSSGRADGVLVIGQGDQHEVLNAAGAAYRNLVVWGARAPGQSYLTVGLDNAAGARAATAHLLARGRRRVAFFGASAAPEAAERLRGVREALARSGLRLPPDRILSSGALGRLTETAVRRRIQSGLDFDAVVCASDVIAVATLKALQAEGRRVPADVMVTGFDDLPLASAVSPSLTTVRQDLALGAFALTDLLFRRMAGEDPASVVLSGELVVRGSTAR